MKLNGFCISFLGNKEEIQLGWFKNNFKRGNWACLNGLDMQVKESGWYSGYRSGGMRDDKHSKKFDIEDIFYDQITKSKPK